MPTEMSVSMVKAPCLRLTHAERWKPQPPQNSTGVVSTRAAHCQPGNCSGVIIESSMTGTAMQAEKTNRRSIPRACARATASASWFGSGRLAS